MIKIITYILLICSYIINSLYLITYYQNDNYHLRSIKHIFLNDLIKRPYILLYIFFVYFNKTNIILYILISLSLLIILEKIRKYDLKLKNTKRLRRLLEINFLAFILLFIFKPLINGLLIINTFYILLNLVTIFISNSIEKLILLRYIKKAKQLLKQYNPYIIGITGSCGKTSIKNYIYECINDESIVYKSPKSYNTLVGLLITINNNLYSYDNTFVLEMGLSYKNDIKKITNIINPNISIISEILPSHLQTMKSIENIINEKMEIVKKTNKNGVIIINNDNEYIKNNIKKYNIRNIKTIKIGFNKENDYYCKEYIIKKDGLELVIYDNFTNKEYKINSKLIGKHNIYNILIVFATLKYLKINETKIIKKLNNLYNYENRLEIKKYNQITILNDSYNSNINGFINALEILSLYNNKKVIITPGIVEIGKETNNTINIISKKIIEICDYCYIIDNENTKYFINYFKENNYSNYKIKKTFKEAFEEVKNKDITLLIENDLPEFYLSKNIHKGGIK